MALYLHLAPGGKVHITDGLTILTRCGLRPSRSRGWKVYDESENPPGRPCLRCLYANPERERGARDYWR